MGLKEQNFNAWLFSKRGEVTLPFKNEILCSIECVIAVYVIDEVGIVNENAYKSNRLMMFLPFWCYSTANCEDSLVQSRYNWFISNI